MKFKCLNLTLILIYVATLFNFFVPMIRFHNRVYNLLFVAIVMIVPIYLFIAFFKTRNVFLRVVSVIISGFLSLVSFGAIILISINIGMISDDGYDPSFEWLREIVVDDYTIDTYRLNGGAMSSYTVIVRQEKRIGFGLEIVKEIYSKDSLGDVNVEWDDHIVTIDDIRIKLKRNIY